MPRHVQDRRETPVYWRCVTAGDRQAGGLRLESAVPRNPPLSFLIPTRIRPGLGYKSRCCLLPSSDSLLFFSLALYSLFTTRPFLSFSRKTQGKVSLFPCPTFTPSFTHDNIQEPNAGDLARVCPRIFFSFVRLEPFLVLGQTTKKKCSSVSVFPHSLLDC